ncbi:MAG: DUF502 domain-containing protein [Opitutaceae bacterium]|jgi:uncharacterized membrane protein|nr:DUF502 domain-containing protein [Opitutaceae bacterium]
MNAAEPAPSALVRLRNAFVTGLLLLSPLGVTWFVFAWLVGQVGGSFRPLFFFYLPEKLLNAPALGIVWNILATLIVIALITLLGYVSRHFLGRFLLGSLERLVRTIPGVNSVYNTVKQIVTTFGADKRNLFSKVVLVQFPIEGSWAIGFLTTKTRAEPQARVAGAGGAEVWGVFVPTTPNPTSGFLLFLPREKIVELEMSVGDGMKLIISGGSVIPPWPAASPE